ncbi:MAG: outer membrane protein assembly factor BamA [Verrucomicrobiota bacterium]
MKSLLRRYCIILALLLYWCPTQATWAQTSPKVEQIEVRHIGPPAVSDELIKANIRVKVGETITRSSIDDDIRSLYATGYFYQIRVAEEPSPNGIKLIYVVQGKPLLTDIRIEGNKQISESKIKKKITSKTGQPLDERKLFSDAQEIQKLYQKSGYQKTKVEYVPNMSAADTSGRATVTFQITESPKVRIKNITFEGAQAFTEKKLAKSIKTRERWMFSWLTGSGVLKDEQFEDDKEKLADFYRNEGYIDFEIKDIKFDQITEKKLNITFVLFEGKQYKVGTVQFKGNTVFPNEEVVKGLQELHSYMGRKGRLGEHGLEMDAGSIFTPKGLRQDIENIQDFYGARGYIDTRVVAIKTANTETGTIDLVYQIDEQNKSFIEKIEIKGNTKTKDKVIRRELAVTPGEVFDMVGVKLSKQRLEGLNFFEKVETQPEPTDVPNRRNLVIGVEEKNTGNFTMGAGFSSVDSVVGFAEITQGNFDLFNPPYFTGAGQKFRLRVQMGTERQDYVLSFVEPWFLNRKLSLGTEFYYRELNYLSDLYDQTQAGSRISLTRALGSDFLIGSLSYTIENIKIDNIDPTASAAIVAEAGDRWVSKVGASLAFDTRNSTTLPDRGQRTELLTELAGGPLGADTDLYKIEVRSSWFFKGFGEGHILEANGRAGVVDSYGDSTRVPLFDRWFLGGLYTLRGYRFRDVGPKDATSEPLGGSTYWFGSLEYSIPIVERVRFALFYDVGMVYAQPFSFNEGAFNTGMYNDNWGIGIRLNLPIGPLRLDYGFPITSDPQNENSGRFQFGVGYTREF